MGVPPDEYALPIRSRVGGRTAAGLSAFRRCAAPTPAALGLRFASVLRALAVLRAPSGRWAALPAPLRVACRARAAALGTALRAPYASLTRRDRSAAAVDPRESVVAPESFESVTMPAAVLHAQFALVSAAPGKPCPAERQHSPTGVSRSLRPVRGRLRFTLCERPG